MNIPATEHPAAQFSSEFAKAHGPNWLEWLGHLKGKPAVGLELGTWLGESAEWAFDNILTDAGAVLHCVDTFKGSEEHALAGIDCSKNEEVARNRLARFGSRPIIHRCESDVFLRSAYDQGYEFDFVEIDAAHDAMNVLRDAVLSMDFLRVGGVMIFDDYEWRVMRDEIDRPKMAVDAFMACYARRFEVIGMGWQVALKKVA